MGRIHEYGCLMALPPENLMPHFTKFGKTAVLPSDVYTDPNDDSYGYEETPHITLKFGFVPDLSRPDLGKILQGIKPFLVKFNGISMFENDKFNVLKYDVELNDTLRELRKRCDSYPNEDRFPIYHPHSTICYLKKSATFPSKQELNITVPITRFQYSGMNGKKLNINL